MILEIYTLVHVLISLVGIFSGFVVLFGLFAGKRLDRYSALPFGPFLAAGPLAAAMGGIAAGAGVGGIVGLLRDQGVSEEEAQFYEDGVKRGGSLVTVRGATEEGEKKARKIMQENGSIETEELIAQPRVTAGSARS